MMPMTMMTEMVAVRLYLLSLVRKWNERERGSVGKFIIMMGGRGSEPDFVIWSRRTGANSLTVPYRASVAPWLQLELIIATADIYTLSCLMQTSVQID